MPLDLKMKHTDILLFFKMINKLVPINLPSYLNIAPPIQHSNTRSSVMSFRFYF